MTKPDYCQLWLTCKNKAEADKITKALLDTRLVACVRQLPANSSYWWDGKINHSTEILLQMESQVDSFDKVEKEVAKLHSYSTFVLEATSVTHVSKSAAKWLKSELQNGQA